MEKKHLTDSQRIEQIIRHAGLSTNALARSIGLNRSETLYQIKNGKHGISKELSELITTRYSEISKAWLLTGEGEMLEGLNVGHFALGCFDADLLSIARLKTLPSPNYSLDIPRFRGAEFAACSFDRAMDTRIPVGATVALERIELDQIVPGYDYVLVTDRTTLLRTMHREPYAYEVLLTAADKSYGDIVVDMSDIVKLYRVMGYVYYSK